MLFATGLMQRVMDKSFADDVPLESKMVSKAVERAQGTVEDRNFEIRKDVLKYDEVMNEQRKIIYRRRQQILDGEDLSEEALEAIESRDRAGLVDSTAGGEFVEEWDIDGLLEDAARVLPDPHHAGAARRRRRHAGDDGDARSTTRSSSTRRRRASVGDRDARATSSAA